MTERLERKEEEKGGGKGVRVRRRKPEKGSE